MLFLIIMLIIVFLFLLVITIKFKIKIENLEYKSHKHVNTQMKQTYLNSEYKFKIIIYTLGIIPIFKLTLDKNKLEKINNKTHFEEKITKKMNEQELIKIQQKYDLQRLIPKILKNIKIEINALNLQVELGTKSALITSFIIPAISTIIAILLVKTQKKMDNKTFKITPLYINKNIININLDGELTLRFINILNTIYIINKKERIKKDLQIQKLAHNV